MFEEKQADELAKMNAEQLAGYYNEKNAADKAKIKEAIEGKASKEDVEALKTALNDTIVKQMSTLNDALKAQGLAIAKIAKGEAATKTATLRDLLAEKVDTLKEMKETGKGRLSLKVAGTMTITGNVTGDVPQAQREPGMNRIARRMPFVADYINGATTSSNVVDWVEQVNEDGAPAGTAEGVLKNQQDFDLQVASENVKKRTSFIKVSKEMLADIDFMNAEIRNDLMERLSLDVDNQMLQGDGTGTNLNGLITQATAFAAGSFALAIDNANNYDVLRVSMNQIKLANFAASVVFMNPDDVTAMQLSKGTDGHYIEFPLTTQDANGISVMSLRVIENNGVPADSFLVMDGSKATAFTRENFNMSVGFENDDFTKNLVTILAEWRGLLRIKGNDTTAFVTGTFTAAKAALETP